MKMNFSSICFSVALTMLFALSAVAQGEASTANGRTPKQEDLPKNIKETLAKQRIAQEKKDYEELVKRSEEAVKLSDELEKSFVASNQLNAEDRKKLERLEKLVKKIRTELGGDDDDEAENTEAKPESSTMVNAFKTLQTNASQLFDEIKKSTRYTVSVVAIQTSNALLKLVKFIRFGK